MEFTHIYHVTSHWKSERRGTIQSPELIQSIEVATPPPFPGGIEGVWSPEHLLVASVNSCLMATFLAIAENSKLSFNSYACKSSGKLEKVEGKYMISEIVLEPRIVINHPEDQEKTERIIHKSEAACLISNSLKSTISLIPTIVCEP